MPRVLPPPSGRENANEYRPFRIVRGSASSASAGPAIETNRSNALHHPSHLMSSPPSDPGRRGWVVVVGRRLLVVRPRSVGFLAGLLPRLSLIRIVVRPGVRKHSGG